MTHVPVRGLKTKASKRILPSMRFTARRVQPGFAGIVEPKSIMLPEPFAKRTVEGDLGIRYNAGSILEMAGRKKVLENMSIPNLDIESRIQYLSLHTDAIPQTEEEFEIDIGLARTAADIAIERHAGTIEVVYTPGGPFSLQFGKDLTGVHNIIGTGGIITYGRKPEGTLISCELAYARWEGKRFAIYSEALVKCLCFLIVSTYLVTPYRSQTFKHASFNGRLMSV